MIGQVPCECFLVGVAFACILVNGPQSVSLEGSAMSSSLFWGGWGFGMGFSSLSVNVQCCVPLLCSYWLSLLASLSSVSYPHPDIRRLKSLIIQLLRYCSLAQLFCGERGTLKMLLACVRSAPSGWTTWGGHNVIMQDVHAPPRTKPLRISSVPLGHSPRWAMHLFRGIGLRL